MTASMLAPPRLAVAHALPMVVPDGIVAFFAFNCFQIHALDVRILQDFAENYSPLMSEMFAPNVQASLAQS